MTPELIALVVTGLLQAVIACRDRDAVDEPPADLIRREVSRHPGRLRRRVRRQLRRQGSDVRLTDDVFAAICQQVDESTDDQLAKATWQAVGKETDWDAAR